MKAGGPAISYMFTPQEAKYSGVSERFPPYMTSDGVGHTHLIPRGAPSVKSIVQCRLELELEFGVQRSLLVVLTSHVAQARVISLSPTHTHSYPKSFFGFWLISRLL